MVIIRKKSKTAKSGSASAPVVGGSSPPVYRQDRYQSGTQVSKLADPRAPAGVAPTAGAYSSFPIGNLSVPTISGTTTSPGLSSTLQCAGDIIELVEDLTHTFTGTNSAELFTAALDHFTIADSTGAVVWNQSGGLMQELTNIAFLNPGAGGSLGGADTLTAVSTSAQENVAMLGGFRLPASRGPWKFTPTYASYITSGGSSATGDTLTFNLSGNYSSNVGGVSSYYTEQIVNLTAGNNYFNAFANVKNVKLSGLFISNLTLSTVDEIYLEQNGNPIEPLVSGLGMARRQTSAYPGVTIPSNCLVFATPVMRSQFAINDSSTSYLHLTSAASNVKIGYYRLL